MTCIPGNPALEVMPRGFRAARDPRNVNFSTAHFLQNLRHSGRSVAQKNGKRYEKRVFAFLERTLPGVKIQPWIEFSSKGNLRYCQPDAFFLDIDKLRLTIFEVKYTHTIDAYWQLEHLYRPVLQARYPDFSIYRVEITRNFDPAVQFPIDLYLYFNLFELLDNPQSKGISVLQWK